MLTVQEIQALTFEKAMFNGYDPKSVDEVIEQITEDYAAMQKENAALKAKLRYSLTKSTSIVRWKMVCAVHLSLHRGHCAGNT